MIAVIGGSGFVGTRLCRLLAERGLKFCIVDKSPSIDFPNEWIKADVRDLDSLRIAVPVGATLINLAAEHRDDVRPLSLYHDVNVIGAKNLCQIANEKQIDKIIFTSSVAIYGFAPPDTGESGAINPFNEYGRTKAAAEKVFADWQSGCSAKRTLVVVRPTVIFGEQNRGNVYNLLRQIASGKFVMIGRGVNVKSMAYVGNVVAFISYVLNFGSGSHVFNYVDKPDLDMNTIVTLARERLGRGRGVGLRIPYVAGYMLGHFCDFVSLITRKALPVSSIRVKKFCSTTQFSTGVSDSGFVPPETLVESLRRTINYEFFERDESDAVFHTE
jgi:nucleoside-diphosphate-sugar epimerase